LVWNASRQWEFRIEFCKADTFLLRDHIILFQDLVKDWTSGPLVQLRYFIPINYDIRLYFKQGFQLFLYVNERNIIENPNPVDADDNSMVYVLSCVAKSMLIIRLSFVCFILYSLFYQGP